jgi:molybdopterin synthase sulfur carrier subunit
MAIKVLVFGQIGDLIGKNELEFTSIKSTDEIKNELIKKYPGLNNINYSLAVNKKTIHSDTKLNGDETIALLPAFSGG